MCLRILGFKAGKRYPGVLPDALSLLGSERGIHPQLTAQGSSAAGTGQPGHLWSLTPVLSMDRSVIYAMLLCFTSHPFQQPRLMQFLFSFCPQML